MTASQGVVRAALIAAVMTAHGEVGAVGDEIAAFSLGTVGSLPPPPWRTARLPKVPRETRYRLVEDAGSVVLQAQVDASMAGLVHPVAIDPRAKPLLEWRWKVSGLPTGAVFGTKRGDDFAARVYVLFDYDTSKLSPVARIKLALARVLYGEAMPAAGLCYVWDAKAPIGTSAWSPYTDRLRMIVLESGTSQTGLWISERRDIAQDFRAAFGEDPPSVLGVAVASDTDNTGGVLTAWYGDLRLTADPRRVEPQ